MCTYIGAFGGDSDELQILQLTTHAHDPDIFRQTSLLGLCIKECISVIRVASVEILLSAPFAILDLTRPFMI